ncbi:MAG: hypothetical protein WCL18_03650 [bacterium]
MLNVNIRNHDAFILAHEIYNPVAHVHHVAHVAQSAHVFPVAQSAHAAHCHHAAHMIVCCNIVSTQGVYVVL